MHRHKWSSWQPASYVITTKDGRTYKRDAQWRECQKCGYRKVEDLVRL